MKYCILLFASSALSVVGSFDTADAAREHAESQSETFGTEIPEYPADSTLASLAGGWAVTSIDEPTLSVNDDVQGEDEGSQDEVVQQPTPGAATA